MILFKFKQNNKQTDYITGSRWVLDIGWKYIQIAYQYCDKSGEWQFPAAAYYSINLTSHWAFGRHHMYYDGPHDSFSIGFIHFCWSGKWCEKCRNAG